MAPPLPPKHKASRRNYRAETNSSDTYQPLERSSSETNDAPPRLTSRRFREDDARPSSSTSSYERYRRRSSRSRSPPPANVSTKPKTMMTADDEMERIREIRARRQRAERQKSEGSTTSASSSTTATSLSARRAARQAPSTSIARQDLESSGLVRRDRRRKSNDGMYSPGEEHSSDNTTKHTVGSSKRSEIQARLAARRRQTSAGTSDGNGSHKTNLEGTTSSGDEHISSDTTKNVDEVSKRSDIQARLAARRQRRYSGDGPYTSPGTPARQNTEALQRSTAYSGEAPRRSTTKPTRHRSDFSQKSVEGLGISRDRRKAPSRSRSSDELPGPIPMKREEANANLPDRIKSTDGALQTEAPTLTRTSSTAISERLRERREARERGRKEREKKYDLKAASKDSEVAKRKKNINDIKSRAVESNTAGTQMRISEIEIPDSDDDPTGEAWSVRLCVISAMDLPSNIVPNMPLCPVLKMGLVKLPADLNEEKKSATSLIMEVLGDNGIETVKSAKVRSTTNKILSKRDNGTIDFHQEYRWDNLKEPRMMGLCVELFASAIRTPSNYMLSPLATSQLEAYGVQRNSSTTDSLSDEPKEPSRPTGGSGPPAGRGVNRTSSYELRRGLFNRNSKQQIAEMQAAEAAAAVARMLVDESEAEAKNEEESQPVSIKLSDTPNSDYDVSLLSATEKTDSELTRDVRLGSVVIPLMRLPKGKDVKRKEAVRLEQWHQLETREESGDDVSQRKRPSVFLEVSLSSSEALDDSEDELEDGNNVDADKKEPFESSSRLNASFSRRACIEAKKQRGEQESKKEKTKTEDPVLEPGVVDFVAVIGCKDIGNQKDDDGMKGWVRATPECVVLEQFPPNNEFHLQAGRKSLLPEMVQWFCYPEGARLWRGTAPPSHSDLNLKQYSAASLTNVSSSIAAFDACLGCTTSFSWFVIASNSDEYGSSLVKTYVAVIRFYAPAPTGIDSTQDDFAQAIMGGKPNSSPSTSAKRLWVPIAICLTSNLPIIGVMEALLLRTCEELGTFSNGTPSTKLEEIQQAIGNIILNYQKPIAGAVNCSVPFLAGDRFLISIPPCTCLPALPHGRAIVSVCRLLGAEGLKYLLAAVLTECKILLHSEDIADIAMVAEVITALAYPFAWSLPYIPVLPVGMIEFVEAPLSYLLGIPSGNLKMIDPRALDETVVVDLNKMFSSPEYSPEKQKSKSIGSKHPPPLPASVSANLSNAVFKLLHAEEQMEEEYRGSDLLEQGFPRLETESLAEREFRVTVAIEICGLLRGYQDCVGPVFNRDKFLKIAPALYEEKREYKIVGRSAITEKTKVLSSRSKRFLSSLVSGQNFQQLLESLDSDEATFFHETLEIIDESTSDRKALKKQSSDEFDFSQADKNVALLMKSLQKNEDIVPTFCVEKGGGLKAAEDNEDETLLSMMYDESEFDKFDAFFPNSDAMHVEDQHALKFTSSILSPIQIESTAAVSDSGMQAVSMEYLAKLETTPWQYNPLFNHLSQDIRMNDRIKLREAIGERRFRAWKLAQDKKSSHGEDLSFLSDGTTESAKQGSALDLATLVTSAKNDSADSSNLSPETIQSRISSQTPAQQRIAAAKSRDIIRRCLDRANNVQTSESDDVNPFIDNGRDLMTEAEKALRNPSAQLFLVSILAQRSRLDNKRTRTMRRNSMVANSASRLDQTAFDCLIRLSCAMLDSCMEYKEYEMAYRLLTNSAGFIMVQEVDRLGVDENDEFGDEQPMIVITMTSRIGLHPIYADIGVWEAVMGFHLRDRRAVKQADEFKSYDAESDDEEEEEVEYEAAVATLYEMVGYGIPGEELSRFAMRASQEHGWFCDDRGRQLLMLARRISIRRDQADLGGAANTGDIDMVRKGPDNNDAAVPISEGASQKEQSFEWRDVAWCHPAAPPRTVSMPSDGSNTDLDMISSVDSFMKRTPVTALASFGSSIVASGGLDGGVFLAHSISVGSHIEDSSPKVRGIHLDWGSASRARTGFTSDGEYGVGAVSCLAAAYGDTPHDQNPSHVKDTMDETEEIDMVESMEGSRIIAGTTAGDLRVWSVKDIYSSILMTKNDEEARNAHTSSRFKYSLRGRALSGHRGGVTCIDVPSQVYRPDSLVTGGSDGLIKLWALRAPTGSRRTNPGGDALNTLSGHSGRILCLKTAWHGDHLLSGGADRTIRVWDLATGGGKCIHKLCGHFGWITNVQYWGPNTIVSASTDRSVALWDARVRSSPLFILRKHQSPISDLLVGSRTDPHMVSAAADGTIATWDFRSLSDTNSSEQSGMKHSSSNGCKIVRQPSASISHCANMQERAVGSVYLSRDTTDPVNSFLSVGSDAILRKWNITTGHMVKESATGHCDTISSFESYAQGHGFGLQAINNADFRGENSSAITDKGFLTSSLDGTIRVRKLVGTNGG